MNIKQTVSLAAGVTLVSVSSAQLIRTGFDSSTLAANDDLSTGVVSIGFDVNFFGVVYDSLFVNNNGNVTFDSSLVTYTPFDLTSNATPIIAPFFGDVDTRSANSAEVTYGNGTVDGMDAFGVNYVGVGVFSYIDIFNSFQVVLVDRSDIAAGDFDIEFNYEQIVWEAGTASGSDNFGLGGASARAGYSNGIDTSFEIPGSAVNGGLLDSNPITGLVNSSNVGIDGRWIFEVRSGTVIDDPDDRPDPRPSVPEPSVIGLLGFPIVLLVLVGRRRR